MKTKTQTMLSVVAVVAGLVFLGGGETVLATTNCTFTTGGTTMTLDADCTTDATILIPNGFTLDGDGHTITAVDPPDDGDPLNGVEHFLGAVVKNAGTVAHVTNLTIDTDNLDNVCDGAGPPDNRLRGILFDGAGGSITNNTLRDINQGSSGCQEGNAIEVRNAPFDGTHPNTQRVTIKWNIITDYQKTGIVANGDVDAIISDNSATGLGPVPVIAQNSIQVGFGATGRVMRNTVAANFFTGSGFVSTGVLVFQADGVIVQDNAVSSSQTGVAVESWCFLGGPSDSSNNKVVRNTIDDADFGVSVLSFTFFCSCDPAVNNNKVVNNAINGGGGDIGVSLGAIDLDFGCTGFDPSADNNKVIHNTIDGYTTDIDDTGTASKVHANVTLP